MKQCPECNRYYPDYTSACKCGYQFPVSEKAESESEAPDGSVILSLCSAIVVVGILTSIGSAIYLATQHHPIIAVVTGAVGCVYQAGLFIVFTEVNRIIGERRIEQHQNAAQSPAAGAPDEA